MCKAGGRVRFKATPKSGETFRGWSSSVGSAFDCASRADAVFTMPTTAANVTGTRGP